MDLAKMTEQELLLHSQDLKQQMADLRENRAAIAREIERRTVDQVIDSLVANLSDDARERLAQRLAPGA